MKTLSERIAESQQKIAAKKDALLEVTKGLDDHPEDDEYLLQLETLTQELEDETKHLTMLERAEKALAEKVATNKAAAIITQHGDGLDKKDSKELWLKHAVCAFVSHVNRKHINEVLSELYPKNKALNNVMQFKSTVPLATTYDAGWAAELVQGDTQGFINLLVPTSVAAAIASRTLQLNFNGYDSITIPKRGPRVAGQHLGGAFVAEGSPIPLGRMSVGATTLSRYKHAVISEFSAELAERSTPGIEQVLRQAILDDMSVSLDAIFLGSANAVVGTQPPGIGFNITPVAGTAGGGIDAVVADLKAAKKALSTAGLGQNKVLILNEADADSVGFMQTAMGEFLFKDDLNSGNLLSMSVIVSQNCPEGTFYLVDASSLATAFDAVAFRTSDVATIVTASSDTVAPTMAVDDTGAIGDPEQVPRGGGLHVSGTAGAGGAGQVTHSTFQTNTIALRAIQPVSWGVVQDGGVYICDNLTW